AFERAGQRGEGTLNLTPVAYSWRTIPITLAFAVTGVLVILSEPGSRPAHAFLLASFAYSFHWALFFGGPRLQTYTWAVIFLLSALVVFPFSLRATMIFPEKLTLAGTRTPAWPWCFAIFGPIASSAVFGVPLPGTVGLRMVYAVNVAFIIALLALL